MSKKNRAKSKAKRFGEGSAKPIVSAATYGVGGNAFAQAIADPVSTVHSNKPELLVVDGYNVIHCTPRYEKLIYDHSDDPYSSDVHDMARTALINDVAAFAQGRYEAVIVFDGAGNISSERPNLPAAACASSSRRRAIGRYRGAEALHRGARGRPRVLRGVERRHDPGRRHGQGCYAHLEPHVGGRDQTDR